jgi:carbonic anhydrase/acetyltransferase-like protein (isoleucine patch superfamily)
VAIGARASVWYGAVLHDDEGRISLGKDSDVQDNAVIHATVDRATLVADEVTIGHGALLEGCSIESGAVIGMGAIVLQDATVGPNAMVTAGSVVTSGTVIPPRMLAAGVPTKVKKEITSVA